MKSILYSFTILFIFLVSNQENICQEDFLCGTNPSSIPNVQGKLLRTTQTIKILLVEFQDIKHKQPNAYTYTNFNNSFFSTGVYVSPNMYSPDGMQVYGSMNDYLLKNSDGNFSITGYVLNQDNNSDGIPDWLTLPLRKGQYDSLGFYAGYDQFISDVATAANGAGLDITMGSTTKLAIIYAGHTYRGLYTSGLNPRAESNGTSIYRYIIGERYAAFAPYRSERTDAKYQEIGLNLHEFLHLMGLPDTDNGYWDMMNTGHTLGPDLRCACPAPINPQLRYRKGWVNFQEISGNQTFHADYGLADPELFKISNNGSSQYWLIEKRAFDQFMTIGSTVTNDYNYFILRQHFSSAPNSALIAWRVISEASSGSIIHANGQAWGDLKISLGDFYSFSSSSKDLYPWSDSRTPPPNWIPNTQPSTNVGMEIISSDYDVNFYSLISDLPSTISTNTALNGVYHCPATVTVQSGATLTISPGTKIFFASGTGLTVYGNIIASGCTFTSQSGTSPNSWGSITFSGSGSAGSSITNANILYGTRIEAI